MQEVRLLIAWGMGSGCGMWGLHVVVGVHQGPWRETHGRLKAKALDKASNVQKIGAL